MTGTPACARRLAVTDWLLALVLVIATVISRLPFRTEMLYAWDGALFARALRDYNVIPHFPQPPGYVFYVGTAKLVQATTGLGDNATYVAISIAAAGLTVGALYLLGALIFGRLAGLLAAGLALTSVSFWLFSEIAYPYTVLALGSTLIAILCWLLREGRIAYPPLAALAFALIAGFRQDLLLFLGPLFAACYLAAVGVRTRAGWLNLGLGAVAGLAGIAAWWIATDLASEGFGSLWRALSTQSVNVERGTSAFAAGERGLRGNAQLLQWFSKDALHLAVFPALAYGAFWLLQPRREGWRPPFLLVWMLPAMLFYLLVHIGEAGYVFSFLPAVLVAAAAGLVRTGEALAENLPAANGLSRSRIASAVGALALGTLICGYHSWLFVGSARLVSAERLACKDEAIEHAVATLPAQFPPETTLVVTSAYLQHLAVYLPQYRQIQFLDPDRSGDYAPPAGVERVVVFDLELVQRFAPDVGWTYLSLACNGRYNLAVVPATGTRFTFDPKTFRLELQR
jgi:4-amino-4-deoxy-L-arabinose transferase-like glycosyltransferase